MTQQKKDKTQKIGQESKNNRQIEYKQRNRRR